MKLKILMLKNKQGFVILTYILELKINTTNVSKSWLLNWLKYSVLILLTLMKLQV